MKRQQGKRRQQGLFKAIEEMLRAREQGLTAEQKAAVREALEGNDELDFLAFFDFVLQQLKRSIQKYVAELGASGQQAMMIALVEQLCVLTWVVSRDVFDLRDDLRCELESLVEKRLGPAARSKRPRCGRGDLGAARNRSS